jgi:hypothetical protein
LAPSGGTFGYDVLVWIGQALFLRHRQVQEIQTSLKSWFWYWEEAELGFPKGRWTEGGSKVM